MNTGQEYSIKRISDTLLQEIKKSIKSVRGFGSVEIFIQNGVVTQLTVRNIKKTANGHTGIGKS